MAPIAAATPAAPTAQFLASDAAFVWVGSVVLSVLELVGDVSLVRVVGVGTEEKLVVVELKSSESVV